MKFQKLKTTHRIFLIISVLMSIASAQPAQETWAKELKYKAQLNSNKFFYGPSYGDRLDRKTPLDFTLP